MSDPQQLSPKRPTLEALLLHPVRKIDNGPLLGGPSPPDAPAVTGSYADWLLDHGRNARFYVGGFRTIRSATRQRDAKYFYGLASQALVLGQAQGWAGEMSGDWEHAPSYNQFRKAFILREPVYFANAAQIVLSCEEALARAIESGVYAGSRFDTYSMMKVIPACYNVDGFNPVTLAALRGKVDTYDRIVLAAAGQNNRKVLDDLASGSCVTRQTARAVRRATLPLMESAGLDLFVGDVRGEPGGKKLGRKNASGAEVIDLDNLSPDRQ